MEEIKPATKQFEKYSNDTALIYRGDCFDVFKEIDDGSVDLVFVDPPYNIGKQFGTFADSWPSLLAYAEWCFKWLDILTRKLKPSGSLYLMTSTEAMPHIDLWIRDKLAVMSRIIWYYDSSGVQAKKYYGSLYEPILFCVKDKKNYTFNMSDIEIEARTGAIRKLIDYRKETPTLYKTTKIPGNVWYIPRVRYRMAEYENHPAQKPKALLERIIKASSKPGELVLDPFAGTFTTCEVAQQLGRRTIGIEMQEEYAKIGLRRLGIARHLNGEELKAPDKSYVRKNGNGIRSTIADHAGRYRNEHG